MSLEGLSRGSQLLKAWEGARDQKVVAKSLDLDEPTYSRFVRGKRKPTLETAVDIEKKTDGAVPATSWTEPASVERQKRVRAS